MIILLTEDAERELGSIADYIAHDNPSRALSFVQELRSKCMGLADMPNGFPLVPRYEKHGVRRRAHGNYLVFYKVEGDHVVILHVLHGAMDYVELLFSS